MVRLDRIYTRGGDKGMTSLGDGKRVPKTHPRIAAYGCVDELNAVLGLVLQQPGLVAEESGLLRRIQNDLFDVGADLCVPRRTGETAGSRLRISPERARGLEAAIDSYTDRLEPLQSFVLPGGTTASAWLHQARVVCRRAELAVAALVDGERDTVGDGPLVYLNRLSDLLFVMARWKNARGRGDVLWVPGGGRDREAGSLQAGPEASPAPTVSRSESGTAGRRSRAAGTAWRGKGRRRGSAGRTSKGTRPKSRRSR